MGFKPGRRHRLNHDHNLDAVVQALTAAPQTIAQLASRAGLHPRTVRRIADALVERGDAQLAHATSGQRGRPARRYFVTPDVPKSRQSRSSRQRTLATVHHSVQRARKHRQHAHQAIRALQNCTRILATVTPATPSSATALDKATAQLTQQLGLAGDAIDAMLDLLATADVYLESLTPKKGPARSAPR